MLVRKSLLLSIIVAFTVSGCSFIRSSSKDILKPDEIDKAITLPIKFHKQERDKCAIAALRSVLDYYEVDYTDIDSIFNEELQATRLITIVNYSNRYLNAKVERINYDTIVKNIRSGDPMIILLKSKGFNHYSVVKGVIENERKVVVNDGYDENVILSYEKSQLKSNDGIAILFAKRGKK